MKLRISPKTAKPSANWSRKLTRPVKPAVFGIGESIKEQKAQQACQTCRLRNWGVNQGAESSAGLSNLPSSELGNQSRSRKLGRPVKPAVFGIGNQSRSRKLSRPVKPAVFGIGESIKEQKAQQACQTCRFRNWGINQGAESSAGLSNLPSSELGNQSRSRKLSRPVKPAVFGIGESIKHKF